MASGEDRYQLNRATTRLPVPPSGGKRSAVVNLPLPWWGNVEEVGEDGDNGDERDIGDDGDKGSSSEEED